jgi:MFS family permease
VVVALADDRPIRPVSSQRDSGRPDHRRQRGGCAGETLLQPTVPAITKDLCPDHMRGRYNAVMGGASQLAAVAGPVVAAVMLGARLNVGFIATLILGCAAMVFIALALEHRIPERANGVTTGAAELSRV